jgi:crotonobetainyl-CoA:carnitine CoA-transferase CaiB-like acyl-CoA transferase
MRVVGLEQAVAAPLCTRHLASLGADVVKIERLEGDLARAYDSTVRGMSAHFVWLNAGKRSLAVDIKNPEGRAILLRLLAGADVLVSNLSPGALERVLDDAELAARVPRLVRCYISGYGTSGPYRNRKAFDLLIQGESGSTMATGIPGSPAKPGVSLADLAGGVYAFAAIVSALLERMSTGIGRRLDVALFDAVADWMSPLLLARLHTGTTAPPAGLHHATISPYGAFPTADGRLINLAVQTDEQWRRLCIGVLEDKDLADDPRYASNERRMADRAVLESRISACTRRYQLPELEAKFEAAGLPWGNLNEVDQVIRHPQLTTRQRWTKVALPSGPLAAVLLDPLLSAPSETAERVPAVGEHTVEILAALGFSSSQIAALERESIVRSSTTQE